MPQQSSPFARSTPVPNALFDELLPRLSGAEWKVLCVVVRQTLGWSIGGNPRLRKERDWITQRQFKQKAGLGSEAISRAIDGLVKKGVIQVLDERDRPLSTPAERRSCRGKLYYRVLRQNRQNAGGAVGAAVGLSDSSLREANSSPTVGCSETEVRKADTTKEEMYKREIYETLRRITRTHEAVAPKKHLSGTDPR